MNTSELSKIVDNVDHALDVLEAKGNAHDIQRLGLSNQEIGQAVDDARQRIFRTVVEWAVVRQVLREPSSLYARDVERESHRKLRQAVEELQHERT